MTWELLSALIVIIGSLVTLGGVLAKLIRTLTRLEDAISAFQRVLDEFKSKSSETHEKLFDRLDDHETRIGRLEGQNERGS